MEIANALASYFIDENLKVREAQVQKIPYMLIIGDKESDMEGVTPRLRDGKNLNFMTDREFISLIQEDIQLRR